MVVVRERMGVEPYALQVGDIITQKAVTYVHYGAGVGGVTYLDVAMVVGEPYVVQENYRGNSPLYAAVVRNLFGENEVRTFDPPWEKLAVRRVVKGELRLPRANWYARLRNRVGFW